MECGAEIYNFSKEDVLAALTTSSQQQIHLNAPTGSKCWLFPESLPVTACDVTL